jgi:hypothetical protein
MPSLSAVSGRDRNFAAAADILDLPISIDCYKSRCIIVTVNHHLMSQQLRLSVPIEISVSGKSVDAAKLLSSFMAGTPESMNWIERTYSRRPDWGTAENDITEWRAIISTLLLLQDWDDLETHLLRKIAKGELNREKCQEAASRLLWHVFHPRFDPKRWSAELDADDSILHALLLSVLFHKGQGNQWSVCARKGCGEVFPSKPGKLFHDPECAHLATVTAHRQEKRKRVIHIAVQELRKMRSKIPWYEDDDLKAELAAKINKRIAPQTITSKWLTRHRADIERARRAKIKRGKWNR